MNERNPTKLPWALLFLGIVCISISAYFVKMANVNGISVSFYRVCFATLFILPFYIQVKNKRSFYCPPYYRRMPGAGRACDCIGF